MKTKQILTCVIAASAVLFASLSLAHPPRDPAKHLERITEVAGLYDDQIPQVQAIFEESKAKIDEIRGTYTLDQRQEARQAMKAVKEETHERLAEVLTTEQMDKLKAHREERRAKSRRHDKKEGRQFD